MTYTGITFMNIFESSIFWYFPMSKSSKFLHARTNTSTQLEYIDVMNEYERYLCLYIMYILYIEANEQAKINSKV